MKYPNLSRFLILLIFLLSLFQLEANNIQVSNVTIASQDAANDFYMIEFDLSWENSWRTSTFESNWDAAWVFIKFTELNKHEWKHAWLDISGHIAPANCVITPGPIAFGASPYVGAMIHRDSDYIGNVNYQNIQLKWDYSSFLEDDDIIEVCVLAIEMVYVPQGAFYVGDGNISSGFEKDVSGDPFLISSETSITLGGGALGSLGNNNDVDDDYNDGSSQFLPEEFPKGFDAFYCMKYEISQSQYTDFLNKLTYTQANARFLDKYGDSGNTIDDSGNIPIKYTVDNPSVACNFLNFTDIMAYLDWSGLRPMTELEFEKACRGPLNPIVDEYAWGNNFVSNTNYNYSNQGSDSSLITNIDPGIGNAIYNIAGTNTPVRCGIFAASAINKTRQETGATYYGIMEMSGNVWERAIWTGDFAGRLYRDLHGDGQLHASGDSNEDPGIWPLINSGNGFRGGNWSITSSVMTIANRIWQSGSGVVEIRHSRYGGRGVRSAF